MNFLLLTAAVSVTSCRLPVRENVRESTPVKVNTITVSLEGEGSVNRYMGHVAPRKTAVITATPAGGTLISLTGKGQRVKAGQTVAVIRSQTIESALNTARANLRQAQDAFDRISKVHKAGGVSEIQMLDIETKLSKAKEAEAVSAKAAEDCRVKAPFDGVVGETFVNAGEELQPSGAILSIIDISSLKLCISVHENDINSLKPGATAKVEIPALGLDGLDAVMTERSLIPSALSHSYECSFSLRSKAYGLMPGMAVKIRTGSTEGDAIVIPAAAVQLDRDGKYVWLRKDGTARKVRIAIGGYSGKGVVVEEGLFPGDSVITEGYQKISSGMKVTEK